MKSRDGEIASMEEERMNETIRQTLAASRQPPEPPLDAMWMNIEERVFGDPGPRLVLHTRTSRWLIPTLAAAAALVLGVGLGWYAAPRTITQVVAPSAVASNHATQRSATSEEIPATPAATETAASATTAAASTPVRAAQHSTDAAASPDLAAVRFASQFDDAGNGSDMSRYLAQTAVLLAWLSPDRATPASDTALASRAGDLLIQTHLLLDSKAGSDPTLHRLLEDLELVLAQVARLRGQRNGTDLQLIHQTLTAHDVLPRVQDATIEASITD